MPEVIFHTIKCLSIIIINYFCFKRTLNYGFVSDDTAPQKRKTSDTEYLDREKNKHTVNNIFHKWWLELMGEVYFDNRRAHEMTLLLHIISCILIYFAFGANPISYLASILWAVNPINTQGSSVWLSGKIYSLSTLLGLAMFVWTPAAPLFYYLTKFFSINAIFIPLAFIGTKYWFWSFFVLYGLAFFGSTIKMKEKAGTNNEMKAIKLIKIIPYLKTYAYYTILCLIPWRIALYHNFLWGVGVNKEYNKYAYKIDKITFLGFILLTLNLTGIFFLDGYLRIALIWWLVNISMWCNFITYQQQVSERVTATPNIGLMYLLAFVIIKSPLLIAIVITFYVTRLLFTLRMYQNEFWHTEYSIVEGYNCNYIWIARGVQKYHMGDFAGAYYDFLEAKHCTPWEFKANYNAGVMAVLLQNVPMAKQLLDEAEKCPYEGNEEEMIKRINNVRDLIKTAEETKVLDLNKIEVIR